MKRAERVTESEFVITVIRHEWTLRGWKADLLMALIAAPFMAVFILGIAAVVEWFR